MHLFDGNGALVKKMAGGQTTVYIGSHYEKNVTNGQVTKYYFFGGQRVAMKKGGVVYWLAGDHLGSTALTVSSSGVKVAELRYKAWGETRYTYGTTPTSFRYTGQRQEAGLGLYHMGARFYDPALARWLSADTLVPEPENPQSLNRFSYVNNNPLVFIDPSGHDLMIVPGYNNDDWLNPEEWKEWIMAYKGWTEEEWNQFLSDWGEADDAGKQQLMQTTGVHIFNWAGFAAGVDAQAASKSASVESMLAELSRQLAGMSDMTLVSHSKGGNLVLNYIQQMAKLGYVQPRMQCWWMLCCNQH